MLITAQNLILRDKTSIIFLSYLIKNCGMDKDPWLFRAPFRAPSNELIDWKCMVLFLHLLVTNIVDRRHFDGSNDPNCFLNITLMCMVCDCPPFHIPKNEGQIWYLGLYTRLYRNPSSFADHTPNSAGPVFFNSIL